MHSHNYRDPEVFEGKTVLCLGGGASGKDIVLDLEPTASKVILILIIIPLPHTKKDPNFYFLIICPDDL